MTAPRPSLQALLDDPAVSYPLKAVLLIWWSRDPLDAAKDAATLAAVMGDRAVSRLDQPHGP